MGRELQGIAQDKFIESAKDSTSDSKFTLENYKRVITHTVESLIYMIRLAGTKLQADEPELCEEICILAETWKDEKVHGSDRKLLDGWLRTNVDIMLQKKSEGLSADTDNDGSDVYLNATW